MVFDKLKSYIQYFIGNKKPPNFQTGKSGREAAAAGQAQGGHQQPVHADEPERAAPAADNQEPGRSAGQAQPSGDTGTEAGHAGQAEPHPRVHQGPGRDDQGAPARGRPQPEGAQEAGGAEEGAKGAEGAAGGEVRRWS